MGAFSKAGSNPYRPFIGRPPGCTHIQLTRKFVTSVDERCDVCHKVPQLGWLYRCTQDSNGNLPASDFHPNAPDSRFEPDAQLHTLSDSILRAAQDGQYTDEELNILWRQKLKVREVVRQIRPLTSSTSTSVSSSQNSLSASATLSTLNSETDPDTEISQLSEQSFTCRSILEPIQEASNEVEAENSSSLDLVHALQLLQVPPDCSVKVCHTCRPIYRERSFQSIDQVVLKGKSPPVHEWNNRRLSYANVLKELRCSGVPGNRRTVRINDMLIDGTLFDTFVINSRGAERSPRRSSAGLRPVSACSNLAALAAPVLNNAENSAPRSSKIHAKNGANLGKADTR